MKLYDLVKGTTARVQHHALNIVTAGPYWASDFVTPTGDVVFVFWTTDAEGHVCTIVEHTASYVSASHTTGEVRYFERAESGSAEQAPYPAWVAS